MALTSSNSLQNQRKVVLHPQKQLDDFEKDNLQVETNECEPVWAELNNIPKKNILYCCIYRHPDSDPMKLTDHFEKLCSTLSKEKKRFFILGDFNFDLSNYNSDLQTQDFLISFLSNGLRPTISQSAGISFSSTTIFKDPTLIADAFNKCWRKY